MALKTKEAIESASHHELSQHLLENQVRPHYWEPKLHYHSARLRDLAKNSPMMVTEYNTLSPSDPPMSYEFYTDLANQLDSLYQDSQGQHGRGRIVTHSEDSMREMALKLHSGTHEAIGGVVRVKQISSPGSNNGGSQARPSLRQEDGNPPSSSG